MNAALPVQAPNPSSSSTRQDAGAPAQDRGTPRGWLLLAALFAAHVACALYFDPPSVLFGARPVSGSDYDTHIEQTWRVIEGLHGWGESWVYDVRLLAGHPNGVIFDADNKGWEYLTYALMNLGVRRALAFNMFLILAHLLVVPVFYASARLFGSTQRAAITAAAFASGIWLFDSYTHWIWWVGTLAFAFGSYFAVLPFALFHRYLQGRSALHAALCAVALAVALLIHPYTFFALVVPMGLSYVRAARTLGARGHLAVCLIAAAALGANFSWLWDSLAQWHYILDSAFFGRATAMQLPADFFGVLVDTSTTGILPTRTSVRVLCLGAAVTTLVHFARAKDVRFLPLTAAIGFNFAVAYLAGLSHWLLQLQPYRFVGCAMFFAAIPAGDLTTLLHRELRWRQLPAVARGAVVVLALVAAQNVTRDALSYFSASLPEVPPLLDGLESPVNALGYPHLTDYRHTPDHSVYWALPKWVEKNDSGRGRFLVQNGALGEQLAWKTDAEILGGFVLRNLEHVYANLFRRRIERDVSPKEVQAYLEAYAVEWVLLTEKDQWFAAMPELFEYHGEVGGAFVLRTRVPVSKFQLGSGDVTAATNRIKVTHSDPAQDLVLRYHFHEALGCRPDCRVEPVENPVGGVPFIRIPAPHPANFSVVNTYGRSILPR